MGTSWVDAPSRIPDTEERSGLFCQSAEYFRTALTIVLVMLYLTITTLILFSTSSSFVAVLAAATSTTHRRNDDNDQEAPSSSFMPPQHSQLTRNNDPIRDGRLVYSDESVQDVIFDFRLAYPPYSRKSLDKLLLLPPKQKQQQQQTNGKMDTDLEEEDAVIVTMTEEMGMAASEDEVVNVYNNDYCDDNSLQNEKSINNRTIMEKNISHVSMEDDYEDTTTTNAHQDIDNAVESSVAEDDTSLVASPEFTNDDDDYDNDVENVTINNDNITLSSSSPSLLESQQLEEDYLTTTTATNADRTTPPQREFEHEITQSNHIMKDDLLDSSSINDNIHLDDTIIVHDDDMSSETTNANSHHQIVDGRSIHDRTSNVSLESLEASYNDLNAWADDDTLSTIQDVVGRQDDSTISTTTIHSSSSTTTTSTISSLTTTTTTTASSTSNANANRQFVDGLDDLPKLFESVEVPDELDVGADGSSMQEVLVGQGIKILWKHVKNVRGGISSRLGWNKLGSGGSSITADSVWRALPWSNYGSSGSEMEEQDNMSLLDSLLLSNDLTDDRAEKTTRESRWVKTKLESFSLVKSPKAKKIWNFAQRKIVQTRQLLDKIVKLFEGEEDEGDYYDETNESFLKSRLL